MPSTTEPWHRSNPFATRHTRPGALPPLAADGGPLELEPLLADLPRLPAAAIVGPHGTGKSTLLAALHARLAADGRAAGLVRLHRRRDGLRALAAALRAAPGGTLFVDGWERPGRVGAAAIRLAARLRGCRLVVTSHRPAGMPALARTTGTLRLLTAIVHRLPDHGGLIDAADVAESFARHGGNLRDALGDLYDRFEIRRRRS